jgi:flagellar assembly protein FliH
MAAAQKFLFDLSFDGPAGAAAASGAAPRSPVTPAEPSFSRTQLLAAETAAREAGHAAGLAEATGRQEERIGHALTVISDSVAALLAAKDGAQRDGERHAIELTQTIIGKLFPALARCNAIAEIAALVAGCMRECADEPRLVLRLPDALFEAAQTRIAPLAATSGFPGKLVILADDTLTGSDCRVEWADGGVERDLARTWREMEAAMIRAIETPGETNEATQPAAPREP